jgi:hypothetical protein
LGIIKIMLDSITHCAIVNKNQGDSMKKHMLKREFIILSAELDTLSASENKTRTERLRSFLNDLRLPYKTMDGLYEEDSFLVVVKDEIEIDCIIRLAFYTFSQKTILFRNYQGEASLLFDDGTTELLGKYTA